MFRDVRVAVNNPCDPAEFYNELRRRGIVYRPYPYRTRDHYHVISLGEQYYVIADQGGVAYLRLLGSGEIDARTLQLRLEITPGLSHKVLLDIWCRTAQALQLKIEVMRNSLRMSGMVVATVRVEGVDYSLYANQEFNNSVRLSLG